MLCVSMLAGMNCNVEYPVGVIMCSLNSLFLECYPRGLNLPQKLKDTVSRKVVNKLADIFIQP